MEKLQALLQELEIGSIELVIRSTNAYDAFTLWQQREELVEALNLDRPEYQGTKVILMFGDRVFGTTKGIDS